MCVKTGGSLAWSVETLLYSFKCSMLVPSNELLLYYSQPLPTAKLNRISCDTSSKGLLVTITHFSLVAHISD